MTTYLLFSGAQYYPEGGADDSSWVLDAESDDDALAQAAEQEGIRDWWKLIRLDDCELTPIFEGYGNSLGKIALATATEADQHELAESA